MGWPKKTTAATVRKTFPTSTSAMLLMEEQRFTGRAVVCFKTRDAAREAADKGATANGGALRLKLFRVLPSAGLYESKCFIFYYNHEPQDQRLH